MTRLSLTNMLFAASLFYGLTPAIAFEDGDAPVFSDEQVVVIGALDKVTARVTEFDLPVNSEVRFGTLTIHAKYCRKRPPEETPETFAFLQIDDIKRDKSRERVFEGWMMASSPALNALEHPVYDVWVITCKTPSPVAVPPSE